MAGPLTMTKREREAYLAELHVAVIGVERDRCAPLAVPIWYDYDPAPTSPLREHRLRQLAGSAG